MTQTQHKAIVAAIKRGFSQQVTVEKSHDERISTIHVAGYDKPIKVATGRCLGKNKDQHIEVPECFADAIPGLRLDVTTILATVQ